MGFVPQETCIMREWMHLTGPSVGPRVGRMDGVIVGLNVYYFDNHKLNEFGTKELIGSKYRCSKSYWTECGQK